VDLTQIVITGKDTTGPAFASVRGGLLEMKTAVATVKAELVALTAAAGGFYVLYELASGFTSWASNTNKAAAALDDLADATGSSVAELSKLANIARVSGTDFNTIDAAIKKLAVGMAGVDDETGRAGKALSALGIQSRDPAQAMTEIAQKFAELEDGSGKAALAVAIFGKSGASLLPVLKDIAQNSTIVGTTTREMAADAEKLEKSLRALSVQAGGLKQALLADLVPTLNEWIDNTIKAHEAGLGWFRSFIVGTQYASELQPRIEQLSKQIYEAKANLKTDAGFDGIMGWLKTTPEELSNMNREMAILLGMVAKANQAQNADKTDRYLMGLQGAPVGYLKQAPVVPGATPAAKAAVDYYLKGLGDIADALKTEDETRKKALEGYRQQLELIDKLYEANAKSIEQIDSTTEGYQKQIDALTMRREAILRREQARLQAIVNAREYEGYLNAETEALQRQIDVIDKLIGAESASESAKAAQKAAEDWQRAADSIGNSLTDALLRGFESGKDWARNFIDTLKNMFGTLVLRPIIQGVLAPVAGGIAGMVGSGSAAASGLGGAGNLLGGGSSLLGYGGIGGLFSGAGGIFGAGAIGNSFALGGMGQALGLSAAGLDAAGGVALTTLGTTLGAAIPVIGAALAIASMAGVFDSKGGPKSGGFATSGVLGGLTGTDNSGRWFTPSGDDASMQSAVKTTLASYNQLLSSLGGSGSAGFALGFDTDPNGDAPNRLHAGAFVGGQQVYNAALGDLGRDDATLQAALATESKRALLAALQASDLPEQIAAVFNALGAESASSEAIDNLLAYGAAMKQAIDAIGGSVVADAQAAWDQAQRSSVQILGDMGQEVIRLAGQVDGTAGSMQALATATGDYRAAVVQTLIAIKQIGAEVEAMFGATRNSLEEYGLSPEQLYDRFRKDADAAAALLANTTDPAAVQQLSARINDDINRAFAALGDEGKGQQRDPLLTYLNGIDALATARLAAIGAGISSATVDPFAAVSNALNGAAGNFGTAAASFSGSAASIDTSVGRLDAIVTRFERAVQTPLQAVVVVNEVG
jgi:hypothetical protein